MTKLSRANQVWQWKRLVVMMVAFIVPIGMLLAAVVLPRLDSNNNGEIYYVSPNGDDNAIGNSSTKPLKTIQLALQKAKPGDIVQLADGVYMQSIKSFRDGKQGNKISIVGSRSAIVKGDDISGNKVVQITHDHIRLEGFSIDGLIGNGDTSKDYRDKLIYVQGNQPGRGVQGLIVKNMSIEHAGGECIRLRYFAANNEISDSAIRYCGQYDFKFKDGGKNGEGIYIGTAPEQRGDGKNPDKQVDASRNNVIRNNLIETYGNECVDIKEGSHDNIVERNTCRHQQDSKSGGLDARGSKNVFRYNTLEDNKGAGIRLGGDEETDGVNNEVYGNIFTRNEQGGIKVQRVPQGKMCGNFFNQNGGNNIIGGNDLPDDPTTACLN